MARGYIHRNARGRVTGTTLSFSHQEAAGLAGVGAAVALLWGIGWLLCQLALGAWSVLLFAGTLFAGTGRSAAAAVSLDCWSNLPARLCWANVIHATQPRVVATQRLDAVGGRAILTRLPAGFNDAQHISRVSVGPKAWLRYRGFVRAGAGYAVAFEWWQGPDRRLGWVMTDEPPEQWVRSSERWSQVFNAVPRGREIFNQLALVYTPFVGHWVSAKGIPSKVELIQEHEQRGEVLLLERGDSIFFSLPEYARFAHLQGLVGSSLDADWMLTQQDTSAYRVLMPEAAKRLRRG